EEKGWAYSVGSSLVVNRDANWLVIGMGVKPENIDTAISIVVKEIEKIKDTVPPTKKELKKAINGLVGERLRYRQRAINQAHFLGRYEALGMGYQYDLRFSELIKDLRIEDMVRVAKKYLHPHKLVIVVVRPPKP
ncbi:MAG TPA: insulinase family protein, partial [Syntrophaceae bacterium]|nr:insulinase family protein [Syntrophaceae bacterium]